MCSFVNRLVHLQRAGGLSMWEGVLILDGQSLSLQLLHREADPLGPAQIKWYLLKAVGSPLFPAPSQHHSVCLESQPDSWCGSLSGATASWTWRFFLNLRVEVEEDSFIGQLCMKLSAFLDPHSSIYKMYFGVQPASRGLFLTWALLRRWYLQSIGVWEEEWGRWAALTLGVEYVSLLSHGKLLLFFFLNLRWS